MKKTIYNPHNLTKNEIDETVTRVKVYLMNSKNEMLLANSNGGCQLPGGHVEEGESLQEAIVRETQEETGIILNNKNILEPFYEIKHYTKNHRGTGKNRLSNIIYYLVKSDELPNFENTTLTENEKLNKFNIEYVKIEDFESKMSYIENNAAIEINRIIAKEVLVSFRYLEKHLKSKFTF